jgi:cytochrome-b5 reductase
MASAIEEALSSLLHDNPLGTAAVIAALAVVVLLVLRLAAPGKPKTFLDPQQFQPLPLSRIDTLTHNTKRFVFKLPDPRMRLGLPTGQHITFLAKDSDGKDVYRPYTPVTDDDTPGAVEFVIKLYEQGKMSQVLAKLKVGDTMLMKGPRGRFTYKRNMKRAIGARRFLGGGGWGVGWGRASSQLWVGAKPTTHGPGQGARQPPEAGSHVRPRRRTP